MFHASNFQSFDDSLDDLIFLDHSSGMTYDDIAYKLSFKTDVVKSMAKGEKNGLNDKIREIIKSVMEED